MIESLHIRLFLDTHPDLTPRQAVTWMRAEERLGLNGQADSQRIAA